MSNIPRKLDQAEFHSNKLKENEKDRTVCETYFAAYLATLRTVVNYVQREIVAGGKTEPRAWQAINDWETKQLTSDDYKKWRLLVTLRNTDIHEEPIEPGVETYGTFDLLDITALSPPFSIKRRFAITTDKGEKCAVSMLCDVGFQVAQRLVADLPKLK